MNTKVHAVTDVKGRPLKLLMNAGHVNDYTGAADRWAVCPLPIR